MATIGFALLYCPLLALMLATVSFSEEDAARRYIAQVANRPPAPPPPLPVAHFIEWPDIQMQRDPFQSAAPTERASSEPTPSAGAGNTPGSQPSHLIASYRDLNQSYVLGRASHGELARFRVGDTVDGSVIERIDPDRVILDSGGQRHALELP